MTFVVRRKSRNKHIFVPYNAKIADITHADTVQHNLTLANAAGTGAIGGETRKIVAVILGVIRIAGTGDFNYYPNEGVMACYIALYFLNPPVIVIANDTQRVQYLLTVANDDWDVYCLGYVVEV